MYELTGTMKKSLIENINGGFAKELKNKARGNTRYFKLSDSVYRMDINGRNPVRFYLMESAKR